MDIEHAMEKKFKYSLDIIKDGINTVEYEIKIRIKAWKTLKV